MQRAGHTDFKTTQEYLRLAQALSHGFGEPFPQLALERLTHEEDGTRAITESITRRQVIDSQRRGRDSNPRYPCGYT